MHNAKGNINKPNDQWRAGAVAPGAARNGTLVLDSAVHSAYEFLMPDL